MSAGDMGAIHLYDNSKTLKEKFSFCLRGICKLERTVRKGLESIHLVFSSHMEIRRYLSLAVGYL
jgi:hypothetical protein